jgi:hypothetical protein
MNVTDTNNNTSDREIGDEDYASLSPLERLKCIQADWELATTPHQKSFLEGRALEVTVDLEACPDEKLTPGGCLCAVCRSYGE